MRPDLEKKLQTFFEGCQRIHKEYCEANDDENRSQWNMTRLKRYVRIECPRAFAFVDLESGEVLKTYSREIKEKAKEIENG